MGPGVYRKSMMLIRGIIVQTVRHWFVVSALLVLLMPPLTRAGENTTETRQPFFLHLNGIGGERIIDHTLITGLRAAGFDADYQIYDWTGGDIGITALQQHE